jgi:hypothetical protein
MDTPVETKELTEPTAPVSALAPGPHQTLAERLRLPGLVADALESYDDAAELVAVFLSMVGHPVERDGDLLRLGDAVVIVSPAEVGEPSGRDDLICAYGRFLSSGARRGVFVTLGRLPIEAVHRREKLDPRFVHVDFRGLQRMAETAAAGEDPLAEWLPPAGQEIPPIPTQS